MKAIAQELNDGARLFFSIALGIGAGALLRLLFGGGDRKWQVYTVLAFGFAVTIITGAIMHAYP